MAEKLQIRKGQEGNRWWNQRPTSEEVANWWKSVPLHENMEHDRYVNGIVIIPQKIKTDELDGEHPDGSPRIREKVSNMTYTPYPKVETRVQYFHDLMAKHRDEWMGIIEPVGGGENGLPPGFFTRVVENEKGTFKFLCCTTRVRVYDRATVQERIVQTGHRGETNVIRTGLTVIEGAPATKMVNILDYYGKADPHSMMKAETGSVGRALGMAGMLVVPGAGVATAEDMNEAAKLEETPVPPQEQVEAQTKPPKGVQEQQAQGMEVGLREEATTIVSRLKSDFPESFSEFKQWCEEREIKSLNEVTDINVLRGLLKNAKKHLARAEKEKAESEEAPPVEPAPVEEAPAEPEEGKSPEEPAEVNE